MSKTIIYCDMDVTADFKTGDQEYRYVNQQMDEHLSSKRSGHSSKQKRTSGQLYFGCQVVKQLWSYISKFDHIYYQHT
ncbi:MAG: hypothetical protein CM15mV18_0610 [uncultured marine virus]|nr:MAG: hypothetical protein CM15mV18_0610 [uncultured marine virus]